MSFLRKAGKLIGDVSGTVIGEPIKLVGKAVDVPLLTEIGEGVKQASAFAGDTVGQVADGTRDAVTGIINQDNSKRDKGIGEIGEAVGRTARGVFLTGKGVYQNGKAVYHGIVEGRDEQWKAGASGLIKTAAVAALAVGIADFIIDSDTAEAAPVIQLDTINSDLAGGFHPESGVPYESQVIQLPSDEAVSGVFPVFDYAYAGELPEEIYLESDAAHFQYMNHQLADAVQADPELAAQFTDVQLEQIRAVETPDGYVWHHTEVPGEMELVEEQAHAQSGHTGGRSLWGGGQEHR